MKGKELASEIGYTGCKYSNGWFQGLKKRQHIKLQTSHGDAKRVDVTEYSYEIKSIVEDINKEILKFPKKPKG